MVNMKAPGDVDAEVDAFIGTLMVTVETAVDVQIEFT